MEIIAHKSSGRLEGNEYQLRKNFSMKDRYPLHWHEYYELEICIGGEGVQILNGTHYPMLPGTVTLLRMTDFHEYIFTTTCQIICLDFMGETISEKYFQELIYTKKDLTVRFDGIDYETVKSLGNALIHEYENENEFRHDAIDKIVDYFMMMIRRKIGHTEISLPGGGNKQIRRAIEYIDTHFREDPSLATVAEVSGYAKNYFSQCFSETVNQTYSQYLCHKKISYSKILLRSTNCPIIDICMDSGFNSLSNYMRVFKEEVGISPSVYRQQKKTSKAVKP